jgi:hypothetical protein
MQVTSPFDFRHIFFQVHRLRVIPPISASMADRPVTFPPGRFGPSTGRYDLDGLFARGPIIEQEYGVFVIEAIRVRGCEADEARSSAHSSPFRSCSNLDRSIRLKPAAAKEPPFRHELERRRRGYANKTAPLRIMHYRGWRHA